MIKQRNIYVTEFTVIILLWILAIISPLLFMDDFTEDWRAVHVMWAEYSVVGVAFVINRFVLMPRLFLAQNYVKYLASIAALLSVIALFVIRFDGVELILSLFGEGAFADLDGFEPMRMGGGGAPHRGEMPHLHSAPPMEGGMPMPSVIPPSFSVLILTVIVVALDVGLRITVTWVISEQKQAAINREQIVAQLRNLQSQVSPHFFMNTLNNIHALIDIDSQRAKQTLIELSSLMSYLLYESSTKESVPIRMEIEFTENYINLMRLRYSKQVKILFSYDDDIPQVNVPPLLFLNFIENSFKYGVDYEQESIIKINFSFTDSIIEMTTQNNNHSGGVNSARRGLGIVNSRKRLDLLYGDRYTLAIRDDEKIYCVNLKIPTT